MARYNLKYNKKVKCDGRTGRPMDGPADGPMDGPTDRRTMVWKWLNLRQNLKIDNNDYNEYNNKEKKF